jgi:predicted component of type VI protein secretion system
MGTGDDQGDEEPESVTATGLASVGQPGRSAMTWPARRTLSAWMVAAMAVGALLLAPARAGAVTSSSGPGSTVGAGSQRINPGEL